MSSTEPGPKADRRGGVVELLLIAAVAIGLALAIQAVLVKPFRIPSKSMVPTLEVGQRVLVDRLTPRFTDPARGDVLVFQPPVGADDDECGVEHPGDQACPQATPGKSDQNFIKRVVGLPGDRLKVLDGRAYVNGELWKDETEFINPSDNCPTCDLPREITVPPGHLFMMGDNRGASADSRAWGPVPEDNVVGNAFFTYWPPNRIGPL